VVVVGRGTLWGGAVVVGVVCWFPLRVLCIPVLGVVCMLVLGVLVPVLRVVCVLVWVILVVIMRVFCGGVVLIICGLVLVLHIRGGSLFFATWVRVRSCPSGAAGDGGPSLEIVIVPRVAGGEVFATIWVFRPGRGASARHVGRDLGASVMRDYVPCLTGRNKRKKRGGEVIEYLSLALQ